MKTTFTVKGFHCNSCKVLVEDVCSDFSEIESCTVDSKTGKVVLTHNKKLSLKKLKEEIESLGSYKVVI